MQIIQKICRNNPCYKAGRTITPKGLMLHSVGCPQPSALVFANNWNKASASVCVHAILQADGTVYQTLPWNHRAWHGGGSSNNTHIGVEMTEPSSIRYTSGSNFTCSDIATAKQQVTGTYNTAVELFAYLCEKYNLNPLTQICSHAEGYRKGIASNHGDPEHLWRQLGLPYTMNTFRADVKAKMGKTASTYTHEQFVRDVQKAIGVDIDGIAGKMTLGATVTVSAKENRTHAVVAPIQKYLYSIGYIEVGNADGIAGKKFDQAIRNFQEDNGCVIDGEITAKNKTWKKLLKI